MAPVAVLEFDDPELRDEVSRAALMLDVEKPDWFMCVNLSTLNLGSVTYCICGQNGLDYRDYRPEFMGSFARYSAEPMWREEIAARMPVVPDVVPDELAVLSAV